MRNKKAFTLLELLAVIVIIAILSLIAVIGINDVIDESRKKAFEETNTMIVRQVKSFNSVELVPQTYTITDGVSSPNLKLSGELPDTGTVEINSLGEIQLATSNTRYCAIKRFSESEVKVYNVGNRLCNIIPNIILTVNPNGGLYNDSTTSTTYQLLTENTQSIIDPTRNGYVFDKWIFSGEGTFNDGVFTAEYDDATLTASWLSFGDMFSYTGTYTIEEEGDNNWKVEFLTDGILTMNIEVEVDAFLVGGGGAGGVCGYSAQRCYTTGGGGGYTVNIPDITLAVGTYPIDIGNGGIGKICSGTNGVNNCGAEGGAGNSGAPTTAFSNTAEGGTGGYCVYTGVGRSGNGGSGGGFSDFGKNGGNGVGMTSGGNGQGASTREFGNAYGILYSSGGNGGMGDGGTKGGSTTNGVVNSGNGGYGHCHSLCGDEANELPRCSAIAGSGGSGIVVIRNFR